MKPPNISDLSPADARLVLAKWGEFAEAEREWELAKEGVKELKLAAKKKLEAFKALMADLRSPSMFDGEVSQ